jgi:hypothetical protein
MCRKYSGHRGVGSCGEYSFCDDDNDDGDDAGTDDALRRQRARLDVSLAPQLKGMSMRGAVVVVVRVPEGARPRRLNLPSPVPRRNE